MSPPFQGQRISQARNQHEANYLPGAQVYIGKRMELQSKSSVPIGLLTEQSEPTGVQDNSSVPVTSLTEQSNPVGEKTRITSMDSEKVC
jgi:hypothetical protein